MEMTKNFEQWLVEEKDIQKGKWAVVLAFLLLPIIGEILMIITLMQPDVVVVPEIGGNKPAFFIQAVIFKYLLLLIASPFIAGFVMWVAQLFK